MPALKKNPEEVRNKKLTILITEEEQATIQRWTKKAKRGHRLNDCSNISELVRKYLIPALERDIEATDRKK